MHRKRYTQETTSDDAVAKLLEIFPGLGVSAAAKALKKRDGNVEAAVAFILEQDARDPKKARKTAMHESAASTLAAEALEVSVLKISSHEAQKDGVVWMWGSNTYGQLAGHDAGLNAIQAISFGKRTVRQVSCGMFHTACVCDSGELVVSGRNIEGQLGVPAEQALSLCSNTPLLVAHFAADRPATTVRQVACGLYHTTALTESGDVYEWGQDLKTISDMQLPSPALQVACGGCTTLALTADGVYEWGDALGRGRPQRIPALADKGIVGLASGHFECVALSDTGDIYTWPNSSGQLKSRTPQLLQIPDASIYRVVAGKNRSAAITERGELFTWSRDPLSGVINGPPERLRTMDETNSTVREVAMGEHHCVAVAASAAYEPCVFAFGSNTYRQLAVASGVKESTTPIAVPDLHGVPFSQISCGGFHSAAVIGPWAGAQQLGDAMRDALHGGLFSDTSVRVAGDRALKAHRCILATRCPGLSSSIVADPAEPARSLLDLSSVPAELIESLLEYVYTDRCALTPERARQLAPLAESAGCQRLRLMCDNKLGGTGRLPQPSLAPELLTLLDAPPTMSDIAFRVEGRLIRAHKVIVAARCEYYRVMWQSPWKDAADDVLDVPDVPAAVFVDVLKYLYGNKAVLTGETVVDQLMLANQLGLNRLKADCERYIASGLDADNAVSLLSLAEMYGAALLKTRCVRFLAQNPAARASADYTALPPDLRKQVEGQRRS